jgi:CRP-like cAMP-binding protein
MSPSGFSRTLPRGGVLWWAGDPATSLGVVERGCLGVRAGGTLIDVVIPGTVLGEAALLSPAESPGRRTAEVVCLDEGSVVVEYPVSGLAEPFEAALGATVLRTLFYQVARNVLVVRASETAPVVRAVVDGLLDTAARAHAQSTSARDWPAFLSAFRMAYRLRECSDVVRAELAPPDRWTPARAREELAAWRERGAASELASAVDGFLVLWSSRPSAG